MKKILKLAILLVGMISFAQNYTPQSTFILNSVDCDTLFINGNKHLLGGNIIRCDVIKFSVTSWSSLNIGDGHLETCELIDDSGYMQFLRVNDNQGSSLTFNCSTPIVPNINKIEFTSGAVLSNPDVNTPPRFTYEDGILHMPNDWDLKVFTIPSGQFIGRNRGQSIPLYLNKGHIVLVFTDKRAYKIVL